MKAVNAGDAGEVAARMADKTVYADLNLPAAVGADAIRALSQAGFDLAKLEFAAPVEEVRVAGDLAVARGTWTAKLTPKAQGVADSSDSGSWVLTLARQGDGSWKWDWLVPNSNQPLPGSTASGAEEQALYQLERDWAAASRDKDAAVVEKILADDFVSNLEGQSLNKRQLLAAIKANPAKVESSALSDMKAMVLGDTAIVHGLFD